MTRTTTATTIVSEKRSKKKTKRKGKCVRHTKNPQLKFIVVFFLELLIIFYFSFLVFSCVGVSCEVCMHSIVCIINMYILRDHSSHWLASNTHNRVFSFVGFVQKSVSHWKRKTFFIQKKRKKENEKNGYTAHQHSHTHTTHTYAKLLNFTLISLLSIIYSVFFFVTFFCCVLCAATFPLVAMAKLWLCSHVSLVVQYFPGVVCIFDETVQRSVGHIKYM